LLPEVRDDFLRQLRLSGGAAGSFEGRKRVLFGHIPALAFKDSHQLVRLAQLMGARCQGFLCDLMVLLGGFLGLAEAER
jgi:hypothetical protein